VRDEFVSALMTLAEADRNVMIVTGDLGFGVLNPFIEKFPAQYLNAGVAEQNMAGLAAGMALEGKIVFTYSIANFNTLRCLEQIRNDICYHNANVKIVSVGGGFSYGALGISHHATEDLAILRSVPNLTVLAPGDRMETRLAVKACCATDGPFYLRLGRGGEPLLYKKEPVFRIGKGIVISEGPDLVLMSTGGILQSAMKVRDLLGDNGVRATLCSMPSIQPFDAGLTRTLAAGVPLVVTVEEHIVNGGLGSCVAEVIAEMTSKRASLLRLGLPGRFTCEVGDQEFLRNLHGLAPETMVTRILETLRDLH